MIVTILQDIYNMYNIVSEQNLKKIVGQPMYIQSSHKLQYRLIYLLAFSFVGYLKTANSACSIVC